MQSSKKYWDWKLKPATLVIKKGILRLWWFGVNWWRVSNATEQWSLGKRNYRWNPRNTTRWSVLTGCTYSEVEKTRCPAVAEGLREHAVSLNLAKYCTNVRRIALKKTCNQRMTLRSFKVTNTSAIRYATYDFWLVFHGKYVSILYLFWDINTYLPII